MKYSRLWYLLIPLYIFTGCKQNVVPEGEVTASIIEYKVTYLKEKAGNIPTKMLPSKMTVIFAGNYALNRIDGFFGQFSLIYIGNLKKESVITMLRLFDKRYVCYGKKGDLPCGFAELSNLKISETGNEKFFLGMKCKELRIESDDNETFYALTTDQMHVENPNITTPYKEINDVLLEFNTRLSLLEMNLTALSVQEKTISWDVFKVSDDYQERPKAFMEKTISELFK